MSLPTATASSSFLNLTANQDQNINSPYQLQFTFWMSTIRVSQYIEKMDFFEVFNRGIHADVIVYIFAHLHTTLRTEGNMLDTN